MNTSVASELTRQELNRYGLVHIEVVFNARLTRAFGRYRRNYRTGRKWIELSTRLVELNTEERVIRVIKHEVAHALTEGHGHDRVWRDTCIMIGGDGERCYTSKDTNVVAHTGKLWRLECERCDYKSIRIRKRKANGYFHIGCGGNMTNVEVK